MNILNRILTLTVCASLFIGCVKDIATSGEMTLDFSKRAEVSLGAVSISTGESRAEAENMMAVGQQFRLYAMAKGSLEIIETCTYTIKGSNGAPVLDAGQKVLTLPYGLFDIYLVGPVTHTDKLGVQHVIADVGQVKPMCGVDLVSSKTQVNILKSSNTIAANALKHKMTKLEINIAIPSLGASYTNIDMSNGYIAIDNIGDAGQFTFDNNGGTVTSNAVGAQCIYNTIGIAGDIQKIYAVEPGKLFRVTDYVLPTDEVNFKISTVFGYTLINETLDKVTARLFTGQAKRSFQGGTYLQLTSEPKPGVDMVCRPKILPWNSGGTTDLDVNNNSNLLFWYSGEDAPEMIGGKLCWRDRSGNGNHAIVVGTMVHDPVNKCYTPGALKSYFQPPELGILTEYTFEVAAQTTRGSQMVAFDYRDGLATFAYLSKTSHSAAAYYVGTTGQAKFFNYGNTDLYVNEKFATYTFTQLVKQAELLINGISYGKATTENIAGEFSYAGDKGVHYPARIWESRGDKFPQQRLYGIRMYKKNMPSSGTGIQEQLVRNYVNYVSKLAKTNVGVNANGTAEYIKDGLILDLRGADAPSGKPAVWPDKSRFNNSPTLQEWATHNSAAKSYNGELKFTKTLGSFKELTYEIVVRHKSVTTTGSHVLLQFKPRDGQDANYMMRTGIYWCDFEQPQNGFVFEQPYVSNDQRVCVPAAELIYKQTENIAQLSCFRQNNKLYSSQNGYLYSNKVANISSATTNELNNGKLGSATFDVFAVRIYNRPLNDLERQHNYLIDKRLYNILP